MNSIKGVIVGKCNLILNWDSGGLPSAQISDRATGKVYNKVISIDMNTGVLEAYKMDEEGKAIWDGSDLVKYKAALEDPVVQLFG